MIWTKHKRLASYVLTALMAVGAVRAVEAQTTPVGCAQVDFDFSNVVDNADLTILTNHYGTTDATYDLNQDGIVDGHDWLVAYGFVLCQVINTADLAGVRRNVYPFFQYTRAFNEGDNIAIAIDPTRTHLGNRHVSHATGLVDVYVIDAGSGTTDGQSLIDMRPSGPDTFDFSGADIQSQTFDLSRSSSLTATGGDSLVSRGYDIVLDINRNGTLDGGDYIDGHVNDSSAEAGFYIIKDMTQAGPHGFERQNYKVDNSVLVPSSNTNSTINDQLVFWPQTIDTLTDPLPLVFIVHQNGAGVHHLLYQHLQELMVSYGYVSVSVNTLLVGSGNFLTPAESVENATDDFFDSLDLFFSSLGTIANGRLQNRLDTDRISLIGHSRGGELVVRVRSRLSQRNPDTFGPGLDKNNIVYIQSIAPSDHNGPRKIEPGYTNFHLLYGSADGDVSSHPLFDESKAFGIFERAKGDRLATYIHGTDHNDFNQPATGTHDNDDFKGPPATEIGRAEAQAMQKAITLAALEHFNRDNIAVTDYFWRQSEEFRPLGVSDTTIIVNEYKPYLSGSQHSIIDSFGHTKAIPEGTSDTSTSRGAVITDVSNRVEGRMLDTDTTYDWPNDGVSDPFNGMARGRANGKYRDNTRGTVFDWNSNNRSLEFEIVDKKSDFSRFRWLTFRAAQGTRHPETIAELGDVVFSVTLIDGDGNRSTMRIDASGAGIEEPYQRGLGAFGIGPGWQNEMETIYLSIPEFQTNGRVIDLTNIKAIRLEFGSSFGSDHGRLVLDDLRLIRD